MASRGVGRAQEKILTAWRKSSYRCPQPLCSSRSVFSKWLQWRSISSTSYHNQQVSFAQESISLRESAARTVVYEEDAPFGLETMTFQTGKLAQFAAGSVVAAVGETKVLVTVVSDERLDASRDFMPLQVEYREKSYAQGRIPNTFMRREGAPKERELLCGRVIDRSIRPLFPKGYYFETQVMANVLSSDGDQDPDILAANAASAALTLSDVPWDGPIGVVRIGRVNGKFVVNPDMDTLTDSDLNLIYSCTGDRTVMIETQAREISNQDFAAALRLAHTEAVKLIEPQRRLAARVGNHKRPVNVVKVEPPVLEKIRSLSESSIQEVVSDSSFGKFQRGKALWKVQTDVQAVLKEEKDDASLALFSLAFDTVKKQVVRRNVFERSLRVDGRSLTDIRELYCEAGIYPALHGSSLFSRGNTQVLCTVTMGAPEDAQKLDSLVGPPKKRFMVHYSFPPFSVNEVGKVGGLNRREVGHGTLAEKALLALLPPEDDAFPYSVRVNSEVMGSDGSSSMATVCGGSLALMDAGIALREHVAGISVGLMTDVDSNTGEIKDYRILTDILGLEDHLGDMDFKIAGTRKGVTAIQLDIKLPGVPLHILCEALEPALAARLKILDLMEKEIAKPRDAQRGDTPRRGTMVIQRESVRRLIGVQGANVKNIQRATGVRITVNDEGTVHIIARDQSSYDEAKTMVEALVGVDIEVGGTYIGSVSAIKDFGAFIDFDGGQQGLLHISEISHDTVINIADVLTLGQQISVVCTGRDFRGNLKFSHKATLPKPGSIVRPVEPPEVSVTSTAEFNEKIETHTGTAMTSSLFTVTREGSAATIAASDKEVMKSFEDRIEQWATASREKVETAGLETSTACSENKLADEASFSAEKKKEKKRKTSSKEKKASSQPQTGEALCDTSVKKKKKKKEGNDEQREGDCAEACVGSIYRVKVVQLRKFGVVVEMPKTKVLGSLRFPKSLSEERRSSLCEGDRIAVECICVAANGRPNFKLIEKNI